MVGKLLIVDDVATNRIVLKARLASAGYRPVVAADAGSALALAAGDRPDLALIAANLPGPNGGQNGSQNGSQNGGADRGAGRPGPPGARRSTIRTSSSCATFPAAATTVFFGR